MPSNLFRRCAARRRENLHEDVEHIKISIIRSKINCFEKIKTLPFEAKKV